MFRPVQNLFQAFKSPANRAGSHRRAVAPAVVGAGAGIGRPLMKGVAVAGIGVAAVIFSHYLFVVVVVQDCLGQGHRQDAVIGEKCLRTEQFKFLAFDVVPLVNRADDVTGYCSKHMILLSVLQAPPIFRWSWRGGARFNKSRHSLSGLPAALRAGPSGCRDDGCFVSLPPAGKHTGG